MPKYKIFVYKPLGVEPVVSIIEDRSLAVDFAVSQAKLYKNGGTVFVTDDKDKVIFQYK